MNAGHISSKSLKSMSHLSKSWSIHPIRLAADADRVEVEYVDEVADDGRKRTAATDCWKVLGKDTLRRDLTGRISWTQGCTECLPIFYNFWFMHPYAKATDRNWIRWVFIGPSAEGLIFLSSSACSSWKVCREFGANWCCPIAPDWLMKMWATYQLRRNITP